MAVTYQPWLVLLSVVMAIQGAWGDNMPGEQSAGYLPGDPRYGLQGEALKVYYRTKPAEWAIYCWDEPGKQDTRRALLQEQRDYVKSFGERVIGYGHFVSDDDCQ